MALKRVDYRSVVRLDRWCFGASSSAIEVFLQNVTRSDLAILVLTGHDAVISKDVEAYTSGQLLSMAALGPGCNYRLVAEYLIRTAEYDRR